jgi:hypothetical protein
MESVSLLQLAVSREHCQELSEPRMEVSLTGMIVGRCGRRRAGEFSQTLKNEYIVVVGKRLRIVEERSGHRLFEWPSGIILIPENYGWICCRAVRGQSEGKHSTKGILLREGVPAWSGNW